MKLLYDNDAILCPNCERGLMNSGEISVFIHEYDDGSTRVDMGLHMECPYCGDTTLISGDGKKACYNYIEERWTHRSMCKFSPIVKLTI